MLISVFRKSMFLKVNSFNKNCGIAKRHDVLEQNQYKGPRFLTTEYRIFVSSTVAFSKVLEAFRVKYVKREVLSKVSWCLCLSKSWKQVLKSNKLLKAIYIYIYIYTYIYFTKGIVMFILLFPLM